MTEVEVTRLLSELAETAETLNRESDSINDVIERFEDKVRALNVGIEVWVQDPDLASSLDEEQIGEDAGGNPLMEKIWYRTQLGFGRAFDTWGLVVRRVCYTWDAGRWVLTRETHGPSPLRDVSRQLRIAALAAFPALLKNLQREAAAAVEAIQNAKKLVR